MTPFFFVHIPKTAGTSFRTGAIAHLGASRVVCDYGPQSAQTSRLVRNWLYEGSTDTWQLGEACVSEGIAMVTGHVQASKYAPLFGAGRTVTFLRDPLRRVQSEFAHFVRNGTCSTSFRAFYRKRTMRDRQSRILRRVPLEAIGFVGITERYRESLDVLRDALGISVVERQLNRAASRGSTPADITPDEREEIATLNPEDLDLYARAEALLDSRIALARDGMPFAHAAVERATPRCIEGWAWWASGSSAPVGIEILVNDRPMANVEAVEMRPHLSFLRPPRGGYVGFRATIDADEGDAIQCRVAETGQRFPPWPHVQTQSAEEPKSDWLDVEPDSASVTRGHVDRVDRQFCAGWAFDTRDPARPARIRVYVNECFVGAGVAEHPRSDVRAAGFHATGNCGFWFRWPAGWSPGHRDHVEVRVEDDEAPLDGVTSLQA